MLQEVEKRRIPIQIDSFVESAPHLMVRMKSEFKIVFGKTR